MRDQKIPVIAFVANTGGLLGLCMGFSLVSVFEILYHALTGALKRFVTVPKRYAKDYIKGYIAGKRLCTLWGVCDLDTGVSNKNDNCSEPYFWYFFLLTLRTLAAGRGSKPGDTAV